MRILVLSRGAVGTTMGSVGVRSYHTARVLAEQLPDAEVTLAAPNVPDIPSPHPRMRVVSCRGALAGFAQMLRHDIVIARDFPPYALPLFFHKTLVLDFYVVFPIEWTALSRRIRNATHRRLWAAFKRRYVNAQLTLADYVACSQERQRDVWVGALSALGLITPDVYDRDPTLERLVGVVPYGVQPGEPERRRPVLKGVVPGIADGDRVLIWNGSIMEWFDAETVVRAMAEVTRARDDVKLYFLGVEHPDWVTGLLFDPPKRALELSQELGLYERSVFFNFGWVPYDQIGDYLAEADLGVCAGYENLEARYSYRTRFVDLFWAGLPIVTTRGDVLAERVERDGLGLVVPPGEPRAFAEAVLRLLDDRELYQRCRCNLEAVRADLRWGRTLSPLVEFCRSGASIAAPKRERALPLLRHTAASAFLLAQRAAAYLAAGIERRRSGAS